MIVLDSSAADIRKALVGVKIKLDFVSIPDANYWGTADSIRHIKDKVKVMDNIDQSYLYIDLDINGIIPHGKGNVDI